MWRDNDASSIVSKAIWRAWYTQALFVLRSGVDTAHLPVVPCRGDVRRYRRFLLETAIERSLNRPRLAVWLSPHVRFPPKNFSADSPFKCSCGSTAAGSKTRARTSFSYISLFFSPRLLLFRTTDPINKTLELWQNNVFFGTRVKKSRERCI